MSRPMVWVEELGFDWVSFSAYHYGTRILSPSPIVVASHMAAHLRRIKIAVLGPIIALNNPVHVAEEFAMLDNLTQGRLVVGLLRGTTNEYLVYGVKPEEAREITTEGMELVLKAWTEPQPFGWQGRHYQYRTVSVWPRPLRQPYRPPTPWGPAPSFSRRAVPRLAGRHCGMLPLRAEGAAGTASGPRPPAVASDGKGGAKMALFFQQFPEGSETPS